MTQPVSPFQRQPVPAPGSIRRDTPDPLPEPQIWAAVAAVGALFAFFGMVLPWFLPKPPGTHAGGLSAAVPTYVVALVLMAALGSWMLAAPTMRRRGAYVLAAVSVACAGAGLLFSVVAWMDRQSLLANSDAADGVDHGHPLLGMWLFLVAAVLALSLGCAALARLRAGRGGQAGPRPPFGPPAPFSPSPPGAAAGPRQKISFR